MTRPKVPDDKRQRTAQACDTCKRRKQKVSSLSYFVLSVLFSFRFHRRRASHFHPIPPRYRGSLPDTSHLPHRVCTAVRSILHDGDCCLGLCPSHQDRDCGSKHPPPKVDILPFTWLVRLAPHKLHLICCLVLWVYWFCCSHLLSLIVALKVSEMNMFGLGKDRE